MCTILCPVQGEILNHVDFERGETYLGKALKPGARSIQLVHNHRLSEWPLEGGNGIVEFNSSEAHEVFEYRKRVANRLQGVTGIRHPHPISADIRFGDLGGVVVSFQTGSNVEKILSVVRSPAMFESFCAKIDARDAGLCLRNSFPKGRKEYHLRFLIMFSRELFQAEGFHIPLLALRFGDYSLDRLIMARLPGSSRIQFSVEDGKERTVILREKHAEVKADIVADRIYCIELSTLIEEPNRFVTILRVDGVVQVERSTRQAVSAGPHEHWYSLGNNSGHPLVGKQSLWFYLDEISCADSPLGMLPKKPVLAYKAGALQIATLDEKSGPFSAVQWQIGKDNGWLLPDFDGGIDSFPPASFSIPYALTVPAPLFNKSLPLGKSTTIPTSIEPDGEYLGRCRLMNAAGNWSEFSDPVSFRAPARPAGPRDSQAGFARVTRVRFSRAASSREVRILRPGIWYDMEAHVLSPSGWTNLAYVDVILSGDPEYCLANIANRGRTFAPKDNYVFNLSLVKPMRFFVKDEKGKATWRMVGLEQSEFADISNQGFVVEPRKGHIRARIRLAEEAVEGPWVLKAYAWTLQSTVSPIFSRLFHVRQMVDGDAHGENPQRKWIIAIIAILGANGLVAYLVARRVGRRKLYGDAEEDEEPESGELVRLDIKSPHWANIQRAREFIEANYTKGISAADVAVAISVSRNWLSKFFSQGTGMAVSQYINELRIEQAKRQLRETDRSISEICFNVGFTSFRNFHQIFSKYVGEGPKSYRHRSQ